MYPATDPFSYATDQLVLPSLNRDFNLAFQSYNDFQHRQDRKVFFTCVVPSHHMIVSS